MIDYSVLKKMPKRDINVLADRLADFINGFYEEAADENARFTINEFCVKYTTSSTRDLPTFVSSEYMANKEILEKAIRKILFIIKKDFDGECDELWDLDNVLKTVLAPDFYNNFSLKVSFN